MIQQAKMFLQGFYFPLFPAYCLFPPIFKSESSIDTLESAQKRLALLALTGTCRVNSWPQGPDTLH